MVEGLFQPIHLVLILAVILIVFGAGKLPEMGGALGRGIREFRSEVHDASQTTEQEGQSAPAAPVATVAPATATATQTASIFCTSCGERVPSGAKFCPGCGASMIAGVIEAEPEAPALEARVISQETPTA